MTETILPFLLIKCKIVKTKDIIKHVNIKLKQGLILDELREKKKSKEKKIIQNSFTEENSQEQEHQKKQTKHKFTIYGAQIAKNTHTRVYLFYMLNCCLRMGIDPLYAACVQ